MKLEQDKVKKKIERYKTIYDNREKLSKTEKYTVEELTRALMLNYMLNINITTPENI